MNRKPLTALKKQHVNALDGHPTGSATTPRYCRCRCRLPMPSSRQLLTPRPSRERLRGSQGDEALDPPPTSLEPNERRHPWRRA